MVETPVTPKEARLRIAQDSSVKASVAEGEEFPLYEHESTRVRLFTTIKAADGYLKSRHDALLALGYKQVRGTLARGTLLYRAEGQPEVAISGDRVPKGKKKQPERAATGQLTLIEGGA